MSLLGQDILRQEMFRSKEVVSADHGGIDYDDVDISDGLFNIGQQQAEDIRLEEIRRDNIEQQLMAINAHRPTKKTVREETIIDGTRSVKLRNVKVETEKDANAIKRQKAAQKRLQDDQKQEVSQIRDFPASLIKMCKRLVPRASSATKALAAFVYANRDADSAMILDDIPEEIIELAATCDTYKNQESIAKNIREIHHKLESSQAEHEQIFYGLMNLLYLRLGFQDENQYGAKVYNVNFRPKDIGEFSDRFVIEFNRYKHNRLYRDEV